MYSTDNIAILMATYNGEKFVSEQIESLLNQTYQGWDLYIHDDGSKDHTMEIVEQYVQRYPSKIHVIPGEGTGGAKNNFFFLMQKIQAPYVMFCDQDDVWLDKKIEKTYQAMIAAEAENGRAEPVLVFTDLTVADQRLNVIANRMSRFQRLDPAKTQLKDCLIQNVITGCTVMINKACLEKSLAEIDAVNIIMYDWWCGLVAAYFGVITFIDEALVLYRQHEDNTLGAVPVTDPHYIVNKMWKGREIINTLELTRKQAGEFAAAYRLGEDELVTRYSRLGEMNKIGRQRFYMKNRIWKSGFVRNLGLVVWG